MKKYRYIGLMVCFLFVGQIVNAQATIAGVPHSYDKDLKIIKTNKTKDAQVTTPTIDVVQLLKEDRQNDSIGRPFRFGYPIPVNYDINNSGEWLELDNGDRMWRLTVYCPNAKSISFNYDKIWLPEGSSLYIYNANKRNYIGGFSSKNNNGTKENPKAFATSMLKSEKVVIEYFEPKEMKNQGYINISEIIFGYRDFVELSNLPGVDAPGSCGCTGYLESCEVDVNCSEGNPSWQIEKTSVAKLVGNFSYVNGILVQSGVAFCSGSLLNNVRGDGKLYFLTANHCIDHDHDAVEGTQKDLNWLIYWNYENTTCENDNQIAQAYITYGATVLANSGFDQIFSTGGIPVLDANGKPTYETHFPDFALLELKQSPYDQGFQAYYNGWDRTSVSNVTGTGIHHPQGKPKKISIGNIESYTPGNWVFIDWAITASGVRSRLYFNSSGSPLYNNNHRVIGQCYSAYPLEYSSTPPFNNPEVVPSYLDCTSSAWGAYGSLSTSWNYIRPATSMTNVAISDKRVRLMDWLDPDNTNPMYFNGMSCSTHLISQNYITGKTETWCQIQASNVVISNNSSVIFNAANGVYIPASFEVQKGSSFEIQLNK